MTNAASWGLSGHWTFDVKGFVQKLINFIKVAFLIHKAKRKLMEKQML